MEDKQNSLTALEIVNQCEWELSVLTREYGWGRMSTEKFLKEVAAVALKLQEVARRR